MCVPKYTNFRENAHEPGNLVPGPRASCGLNVRIINVPIDIKKLFQGKNEPKEEKIASS